MRRGTPVTSRASRPRSRCARPRPGRQTAASVGWALVGWALAAGLGACAGDGAPRAIQPAYDLHDPSPRRRVEAVQEVRRRGEHRWIPELIELLDDRDEAVRLVASGALRDLTGHDTGYRAFAPAAERRAQVQAWRDWHAATRSQRTRPEAASPPGVGVGGGS